jgi:hypothetical protein
MSKYILLLVFILRSIANDHFEEKLYEISLYSLACCVPALRCFTTSS